MLSIGHNNLLECGYFAKIIVLLDLDPGDTAVTVLAELER